MLLEVFYEDGTELYVSRLKRHLVLAGKYAWGFRCGRVINHLRSLFCCFLSYHTRRFVDGECSYGPLLLCYSLHSLGSIPGRGKTPATRPVLGHFASIRWVPGVLSEGVMRPGSGAYHSSPSSAEVKNGRAITLHACRSRFGYR
jgi:hypothetical protein